MLHNDAPAEHRERLRLESHLMAHVAHPAIPTFLELVEDHPYTSARAGKPKSTTNCETGSTAVDLFGRCFSGKADLKTFVAMEWVEGHTLAEVFGSLQPNSQCLDSLVDDVQRERTLVEWWVQAAEALQAMHDAGIIHRDVKPHNLMVSKDGRLRLLDLGIARRVSPDATRLTAQGKTVGTELYMSPEQLAVRSGSERVGPSSDVYSLCATFYELFTRSRFYGVDPNEPETIETATLAKTGPSPHLPARPREFGCRLRHWQIETLLMGGLELQPEHRPGSMRALADDLRRAVKDEAIVFRPPSTGRRVWLWCLRNRALASVTLAAALAVVVLAIVSTVAAFVANQRAERAITAGVLRAKSKLETEGRFAEAAVLLRAAARPSAGQDGARMALREGLLLYHEMPLSKVIYDGDREGKSGEILHVAVSRDVGRLYSVSRDGVEAWDAENGLQLWSRKGAPAYVARLLDGDSRLLVGRRKDRCNISPATGALVHELNGHRGNVTAISFNEEQSVVITADWSGIVQSWRLPTLAPLAMRAEHKNPVRAIAICPRQSIAAVGYGNRIAVTWDFERNEDFGAVIPHSGAVTSISCSHAGQRVAVGTNEGTLIQWRAGEPVVDIVAKYPEPIWTVRYSPDGESLAVTSFDGSVRIHDPNLTVAPLDLSGHRTQVGPLAYSPDGQLIATGSEDGEIRLWHSNSGALLHTLKGHRNKVWGLTFAGKSDILVSWSNDSTVRLWKFGAELRGRRVKPHRAKVSALSVDRNGRVFSASEDGSAASWLPGVERSATVLRESGTPIRAITAAKGGQSVVLVTKDGHAVVYDLRKGKLTRPETLALAGVSSAAVSPEGQLVALATDRNQVRIWERESRRIRPLEQETTVSAMAFDTRGERFAIGTDDGRVQVLTRAGEPLPEFRCRKAVKSLGFTSTGALVGGCWDDTAALEAAFLWNDEWKTPVRRLVGHNSPVIRVASSDDGLTVYSVSTDGFIGVWDGLSGTRQRLFRPMPSPQAMAFLPSGRVAIVGENDGRVTLWDAVHGRIVGSLAPHIASVSALTFDASGDRIVAGLEDGSVVAVPVPSHARKGADPGAVVERIGRDSNLRPCQDLRSIVPVIPFPDAESFWAPTEDCANAGSEWEVGGGESIERELVGDR